MGDIPYLREGGAGHSAKSPRSSIGSDCEPLTARLKPCQEDRRAKRFPLRCLNRSKYSCRGAPHVPGDVR